MGGMMMLLSDGGEGGGGDGREGGGGFLGFCGCIGLGVAYVSRGRVSMCV